MWMKSSLILGVGLGNKFCSNRLKENYDARREVDGKI